MKDDIQKSLYRYNSDDFASRFYGTDLEVEALQLVKEARQLDRQRSAIYEKYPYDSNLSAVGRAKQELKRSADLKRQEAREQACCKRGAALEDKALDMRIQQAKMRAKGRKQEAGLASKGLGSVAAKVGKLAVAGAKVVGHEARQFIGKEGNEAVNGAKHGYHAAHQAVHGDHGAKHAPDAHATPKTPGAHKSAGKKPKLRKGIDVDIDEGMLGIMGEDGHESDVDTDGGITRVRTSKEWKRERELAADAVALPPRAFEGEALSEIPIRVEVLGDSALELSERMTLVKSAYKCAMKHKKNRQNNKQLLKSVAELTGERNLSLKSDRPILSKGSSLDDFASAMGTTPTVVRSIARRLGSRDAFSQFIKSKLPDIQIAHGLDDVAVRQLYNAAVKVVKSLDDASWNAWRGFSQADIMTDEGYAAAVEANGGLLENNPSHRTITIREPVPAVPSPDRITEEKVEPVNPLGFIGGPLGIADAFNGRR